MFMLLIQALGLITLLSLLINALKSIRTYTRPSRLGVFAHASLDGEPPWALVTGASNGIGRAYAFELAANGFNVVLHGRNEEKLSKVMGELSTAYPCRMFKTMLADAGTVPCTLCLKTPPNDKKSRLDFAKIRSTLGGIYLTVLINNAGGGPFDPVCRFISESSESDMTENISLNGMLPLFLTRALLPILHRNSPSLVINMSTMIDQGFPLLASYTASKQFLMSITTALRLEMEMEGRGQDVEVLGIKVGKVTGARGHTDPVSLFVPNAATMATAALSRAGYGGGIVIGYWGHAVQQLGEHILGLLPQRFRDGVYINVMRQQRAALDGGTKLSKRH